MDALILIFKELQEYDFHSHVALPVKALVRACRRKGDKVVTAPCPPVLFSDFGYNFIAAAAVHTLRAVAADAPSNLRATHTYPGAGSRPNRLQPKPYPVAA